VIIPTMTEHPLMVEREINNSGAVGFADYTFVIAIEVR